MGYNSSDDQMIGTSLLNELLATQKLQGLVEPGFFLFAAGREQSLSFQKLKCFCLAQFVGLSINYLGEMGCKWEAVSMKGWNI